jgi:hypothetical protein
VHVAWGDYLDEVRWRCNVEQVSRLSKTEAHCKIGKMEGERRTCKKAAYCRIQVKCMEA